MKNILYISFLNRLYWHCQKNNGKVDIRKLITKQQSYDDCFDFMLMAEQDGICEYSMINASAIIYIDPVILCMDQSEFQNKIKEL